MTKAIWEKKVIAASDQTIAAEGNHYFPLDKVNKQHLRPSTKQTICPWKGKANYYDVVVDGKMNRDAAWQYRQPKKAAEEIKDHIAFWRGVQVE